MKSQEILTEEATMIRRVENYWDTRSPAFAKVRRKELMGGDARSWKELISHRLPQGSPLRVLDVGTGAGFFSVIFSRMGHEVTGIDMSSGMLVEAQRNLEFFGCRAELLKMNAQALEFPEESFDVIVSRQLTWTLPDVMEAYREWHRVLKAGGVLLNFDSDCGEVTFKKTEEQENVHAGIADDLIAECNEIKNRLRITTHRRPEWDRSFLEGLGFLIEVEEDIAPLVRRDPGMHYDNVPLFAIYGQKRIGCPKIAI